jgi:hypothetical protein
MVYHSGSLNYRFTILIVRRALGTALLIPGFGFLAARLTHENQEVFGGHRQLMRRYGRRYLTDKQLFLNNNTDGPGNPLSKVYSRRDAGELFADFSSVTSSIRYLNLRLYPGGERFSRTSMGQRLERTLGWHLCVSATK